MANTVYHYTPTSWVNGTTPANATNLNHLETQALDVLSGLNPDLLTAFVLNGITCTKDGTNANQLDIAAGRAYATQTDGTLALIVVAADNTHTTTLASQTYYLYLQPDGTWYWNTVNSGFQVNSLFIAQVTTDGSGNINAVTDKRTLTTSLLSGAAGGVTLAKVGGQATAGVFGMPVIVAQVLDLSITTTGSRHIISYVVPASGLYRVSGHFSHGNTGTTNCTFGVTYTDPHIGTPGVPLMTGTGATPVPINNIATGQNVSVPVLPLCIYAAANSTIFVDFNDASGAPSDFVTAVIERLS